MNFYYAFIWCVVTQWTDPRSIENVFRRSFYHDFLQKAGCGTDLGIWKGKNPEIEVTVKKKYGYFNGRILGHEGIGIIEEVGEAVKNVKKGDKVIISCISRCGACENCQKQLYSHCMNEGGWVMGQGGIPLCLKIAQQPIFERYTQ